MFHDPGRGPRLLVIALAMVMPGLAFGQMSGPPAMTGMPPPNSQAGTSWNASLDEYNRPPGTVVAEVGSRSIIRADVVDAIRAMPPIVSAVPLRQLLQDTASLLMERTALVLSAESAGLDKDPDVQRRMKNAGDEVLAGELLRRSIESKVTGNALHELYDQVVAGKPGPDTVRSRIIMVESEEEAMRLIALLRGAADFGDLARQFSKDGTASNGGDLGYMRLDMLSPELGSVIFALAPGQTTEFPVRSGNRWFIIKVEGRVRQLAPGFEAVRDALEQDVIHAATPELMRLALQNVAAKYYGPIGKSAADETTEQGHTPEQGSK